MGPALAGENENDIRGLKQLKTCFSAGPLVGLIRTNIFTKIRNHPIIFIRAWASKGGGMEETKLVGAFMGF